MAPHSSILAWKIPWMEEPGRLQSMGSQRVGHDWSDLAAAMLTMHGINNTVFHLLNSFILYGFFSSHVWMWELDYKGIWVPKNWCFWTVVLEKTLESPLNCKEPQVVYLKGDQSWVFIGRTDAAAAKSIQSFPTLWDPIDDSPPGFPVPGILPARTLAWIAISFSNAWKWKLKEKLLSRVRPSATPWTAAFQAPPPMGFSRQEYWSGVPLPTEVLL